MKKHLLFALLTLITPIMASPALHTSTNDLRPETSYEIIFDKAVVPQKVVNTTTTNDFIEITPKFKGSLHWTAPHMAHFIPAAPPKMGTKYTFELKQNLLHLDKSPIPAGNLKTLTAEAFGPNYHRKSHSNNRLPINYLRFNDDISPATISDEIYYTDKVGNTRPAKIRQATWADLESTYYIRPSWQQRFKNYKTKLAGNKVVDPTQWTPKTTIKNGLIVTPKDLLPVGENWKLVISKGLSGTSGEKTIEPASYQLWDIKPFKVTHVIAGVMADEPRQLYIHLSAELPKDFKEEALNNLITINPTPADLKFKIAGSTITALGDFSKSSNYTVTVSEDLIAKNGLPLEITILEEVVFHNVPSGIGIPSFDDAQLSKGTRTYLVDTVNMRQVHIRIKSLDSTQLIRTTQAYRSYTGNGPNNKTIKKKHPIPYELVSGKTIFDKIITLDNPLNTSKKIPINWSELLPPDVSAASLFISVTAEPKAELNKKESLKRQAQSIIQLTDIGLAWKVANDKIWVYAYSLDSGKPLPNTTVKIFGEDAKILQTAKTNEFGMTEINRSESERHLLATKGDDRYAVTFDSSLDTLSMWRFPVRFDWTEENFWQNDLYAFTDRDLFRPSETVRFKGILRQYRDNTVRLTKTKSIKVQLRDPSRKVILEKDLTVSKNGTIDLQFDLPSEKIGYYSIHCEIPSIKGAPEDTRTVFTHGFQVQEFRRNAFEITSNLPKPKVAQPQIQFDFEAKYYQGTPVAKGHTNWFFTATPTGFYPDKFRDFQFSDHRQYDPYYWSHYFGYGDGSYRHRENSHKSGKLDLSDDGASSITVDIPKIDFPSPQVLTFNAEITDSRDQTLSTRASVVAHPADTYFGIARVDKLIRVNQPTEIDIVAVNIAGEYITADKDVTINLTREYYETVKIKANNGTYRNTNQKHTEDLGNSSHKVTAETPSPYTFNVEKPGRYIVSVTGTDSENRPTASASTFYVYGAKQYPWATEDGVKIKLVSEKQNHAPGDTARLLVMTPIEGTALITVERQGVIKTFRRELSTSDPVIELPVDASMAPNAYVSVLVMRGTKDSTHKHKQPALRLGFCEIKVTDLTKKLNIALEIPGSTHRPGEPVTLQGKVTDHKGNPVSNTELVLYAEDEGTLAVMGYQNPAPLSHFHRAKPLTIRTGVSLGYFLSEDPNDRYIGNKGFTIGGGGSPAPAPAMDEAKIRKNFDPCAAWFPTVQTDSQGNFAVTFNSPDTLTRYRVLAVALNGNDKFGSAKTELIVNKNLMLEPKPPRFAYEGDRMTQKVLVQNASKVQGTWDISLTTDSLTAVQSATENSLTKEITLAPGQQTTVSFNVEFLNTGETKWVWKASPRSLDGIELTSATRRDYSDAMENKFQITYPRPLLRHSNFNSFADNNNAQQNLIEGVNPIIMNGRGHVDIELSNSRLLEAAGAVDYLLQYPYGCLEQTTSSLMPWFAVRDLKSIVPGFSGTSEEKIQTAIQKGANRILSMQTESGGLSYWPGEESPSEWSSAYGGLGFIMAKKYGANVPDQAITGITKYLAETLRREYKGKPSNWFIEGQTRTLYVLALAGKPEHAFNNKFYENRANLTASARAYLALAIHHAGGDKQLSKNLLTEKITAPKGYYWMHHSEDIPAYLLAWSTIDPKGEQTEQALEKLLDQRNRRGHWHTTWVNSWALQAMATYARNVESGRPNPTITITTSGETKTIKLTKQNPIQTISLPLAEAQTLTASSDHRAFIRTLVSAKPEVAPSGPIANGGLAVTRQYERIDEQGNASPLDNPKVGDLVRVTLNITFAEQLDYVVIDDSLPSTFEAINDKFASQSSAKPDKEKRNWNISRTEIRSDRALFFLNRSWRNGTNKITYLARITAAGAVHAPPTKLEAMYNPQKYALSETGIITTTPNE